MPVRTLFVLVALVASLLGGTNAEAAVTPTSAPTRSATTAPTHLGWTTQPGQLRAMTDAPQPVTWGWCGVITPEKKLIRRFKKKGGAKVPLYCGGPKYSSRPTWGLRHILWRHEDDWERKAFGTHQGWRELVDISVDAVLRDPDIVAKNEVANAASPAMSTSGTTSETGSSTS